MTIQAAIDELDALIVELQAIRAQLARPGLDADEEGLWELEVALRHVGQRTQLRADLLRRQIERQSGSRQSA